MFCGMSLILFLQETSAYNVCTLEGKESLKENVRLCMGREGGFVALPASSFCVHIIISLITQLPKIPAHLLLQILSSI